tara:strand:+ start:3346 stop:3861 length:516 start_codon:yes stop_codon:yes gene_type:complete
MTNIDKNIEWNTSLKIMQGLFPKWNVTGEQLNTWKQEFGMLNPEWYREALRVVYGRYNADNPKPKWVKEAFKQVRAGHQGIPLNESDSQSDKYDREKEEWDNYAKIVERDKNNAYRKVSEWPAEERKLWGKKFKDKFNFLSDTNDLENFSTWSKTFCQQVMVYRRRFSNAS